MGGENKLLRLIAGKTAIHWCLETLAAEQRIGHICLVYTEETAAAVSAAIQSLSADMLLGLTIRQVPGGVSRGESVKNGLEALQNDGVAVVAIHDAARPLMTGALLRRCLTSVDRHGSGIAAHKVVDTLREVNDQGEIVAALERDRTWAMETPQCFLYDEISDAYQAASRQAMAATDDASIFAAMGYVPVVVANEEENSKLTYPGDLKKMQQYLQRQPRYRIGLGEDTHRLVEGRALILAGCTIPYEKGLLGHSDADVVAHALSDALLGALALGDIGKHFPDKDPTYEGANSLLLLQNVMELLRAKGYCLQNADVTITAEAPKLAPYIQEMRNHLAQTLCVDLACISVKATTAEGLGPEGRGESITARSVVLIAGC